ncbi:MAG: hypothetical protein GXY07_13785 [Candidatus Hydrogenedentes bacterium]|nr:hypothetical protein [Candidatus Hydrogenedentota bacterium]
MNSKAGKTGVCAPPFDYVRARRTRRSFRLLVALTVFLTLMLWFVEGYLRYDRSETQYRMALTLHPAQARPILRTVVRRETGPAKVPPSLYLEALAQVEEPDNMLDTYARAYQVNPNNASLVINYGCMLYFDGQHEEARERFREAGVNPPRNALPRYLEAAALAATLEPEADLSDLVALLTRANSSGDPVLFPDPLWHVSLPKRGARYNKLRRDTAERMATPLLHCCNLITGRARQSLERGELMDWDNWLEKVQYMGMRLMGGREDDSPPTMIQMNTALQIQHQALVLRGEWSKLSGGVLDPEINNAILRVNEALAGIAAFEERRQPVLAQYRESALTPLMLAVKTGLLLFVLYSISLVLHKAGSGGKRVRALPHVWAGKLVPVVGFASLLAVLFYLSARHHLGMVGEFDASAPYVWSFVLGVMLLLGLLYPMIQARAGLYQEVLPARTEGPPDTADGLEKAPALTVRRYIGVYGCLLRRYMGVLCGGFMVIICLWCISHRVVLGTYPFQMELLTTGLEKESAVLISEIQQHLRELFS